MKKNIEIRRIAELYFDGEISPSEERILYKFLKKEKNVPIFRNWENSWLESKNRSLVDDEHWMRLNKKIHQGNQNNTRFILPHEWIKYGISILIIAVGLLSAFWVFSSNNQVEKNFIASSGNQSKVLKFNDGSVVFLQPNSEIEYNSSFGNDNRIIKLKSGIARFDVKHREGKEFRVKTTKGDIVVRGTKFEVSLNNGEDYLETKLFEGKVVFVTDHGAIELKPGETLKLSKDKDAVKVTRADDEKETRLIYEQITLVEFISELEKKYNQKINVDIQNHDIANKRLNISLKKDESLNDVFESLKVIVPMSYKKVDGVWDVKF
ncbi:FecR family protein [Ornithobacterium rhinotracheale]|uniref:FecR family protein n=1 Tax=Ornithobacterium rhinotracheale TaxID=28251 RepID=UPI00129C7AD5|nr:FecR family protein [Ornithobacterium rhinotracheale]MRI63763.1 FecR family protein [Ornithobacterium rhinotracheale]